jgi:CHAT domain-containing protein
VNEPSGHLTDAQIQESTDGVGAPEVEGHLSGCEFCRGRLLALQRDQFSFVEMQGMRAGSYSDCPGQEALQDVVLGLCSTETRYQLLQHAAQCDHCGPLVNQYLEEFSEEISPETEAVLHESHTSDPNWQRQTVRKLFQEPQRRAARSRDWFPSFLHIWPIHAWPKIAGLAGAAALVAFVAVNAPALKARWELRQAKTLVARAYSKQRATEMRLTAVDFGEYHPPRRELGPDASGNDTPELLEAKSKVRKEEDAAQSKGGLNSSWWQIKGRLALLEDSADSWKAEKAFAEAQAKGLRNPGVDIDLAASYFENAIRSAPADAPPNVLKTINLLNEVLKNPTLNKEERSVALFDLAIAYQESNMLDLAVATWDKYLEQDTDPSSPWGKEARERRDKAKAQLPRANPTGYNQPSYFLQHSFETELQNDVEQYQEFALARWLPLAFTDPGSSPGRALPILAELMQQQHGDGWWKDFLQATGARDLAAVRALSRAVVADQNDMHVQSLQESREAATLFARDRNLPGELMARFQEVYALQRSLAGSDCLKRANDLWTRLSGTNYRWLQGQVALERGTCAGLASDSDPRSYFQASQALAHEFNLPELNLRIAGLEAGMIWREHDCAKAWSAAVAGLALYWKHSYSPERLYQFYTVMRLCAAEEGSVYAAEELLRRSIQILEDSAPDDQILQALLHLRFATLLGEQGQNGAAEVESGYARDLLEKVPVTEPTARIYSAHAAIELAKLELSRGNAQLALSVLESVRHVLTTQDNLIKLTFYTALGNAKLQLHQIDDAAVAYERAIDAAALFPPSEEAIRLPWIRATNQAYRGITQVLLEKKQDAQALAIWEWSKGRPLENRNLLRPNVFSPATVETAELVPTTKAVHIVYASFPERLQVWIVKGGHIRSRSIDVKQAELRRLIRDFTKGCSTADNAPADKIDKLSQQLYALLLTPVITDLTTSQTVAIELDEAFLALSMEALRGPEGRYFGEEYAIVYSPGFETERALRDPLPIRTEELFLAVDASTPTATGYLPGHDLASSAVQRLYPSARLMHAGEVTPMKLKGAMENSAAFQFFGHARRNGTGMGLDLGEGSLLTAQDLSPKTLQRMRLAVLAACSSGSAEHGLLDSGSLVRAFLAGGVPTVLNSHWNLDSQTTAELVQSFYLHLATEPPAQALRDARRDLRLARPHPFYWAAVSLTGKSN